MEPSPEPEALVVGKRKSSNSRCFLSGILTMPETLNFFLFFIVEERVRFFLFIFPGVAVLESQDLPKVSAGEFIPGVVTKGEAVGSGLELAAIGLSLQGVGCSEQGRMVGVFPA